MTRWRSSSASWPPPLSPPRTAGSTSSRTTSSPASSAEYRSLADPKATVTRIEPKPAFTLGRSSPHPRIPPGPFEVTWTGVVSIRDPGPLAFSALVGGERDGDDRWRHGPRRPRGDRHEPRRPARRRSPASRGTTRSRSATARWPTCRPGCNSGGRARRSPAEPIPAWRFGHVARRAVAGRSSRSAGGARADCRRQVRLCPLPRARIARGRPTRRRGRRWPTRASGSTGPGCSTGSPTPRRSGPTPTCRPSSPPTGPGSSSGGSSPTTWPAAGSEPEPMPAGDHRAGRQAFLGLGCAACHFVPDVDRASRPTSNRTPLDRPRRPAVGRRPGRVPRQPARPLPRRPDAAPADHPGPGPRHRGLPAAVVEADRASPASGAADGEGDSGRGPAARGPRRAGRRPRRCSATKGCAVVPHRPRRHAPAGRAGRQSTAAASPARPAPRFALDD